MTADAWNPTQYERFAAERRQPFDDLLSLLTPAPGGHVVDLGCGSGELTHDLHRHLGAVSTLGIDSSPAMLERSTSTGDVRFEVGDLATFGGHGRFDVIAANAALHWVPDHEALLTRLAATLRPGGQLAVQVPNNHDHASHTAIDEIAFEPPFFDAMGGSPPPDPVATNVLAPTRYAELLHALGFDQQHVRLQVYGHVLAETAEIVEWTKGTNLTRIKQALPDDLYLAFVERYRERLVSMLGDHRPYFYAFKRILLWGRTAA